MNLEDRLARLEREARIWRTAAVALGAMLVAVVGIAAAPRAVPDVAKPQLDRQFVSKSLQTQILEIVNEQGLPAIVLHAGKGGGMLTTFTTAGQPAVVLAATADGGAI